MTFSAFLSSLVRGWYLVVACLAAGILAALGLSAGVAPSYTATSTLLVSAATTDGQSAVINLVPTYAQVATMNAVLAPAASELDYQGGATALAKKVSAVAPDSTSLVQVSAVDEDPQRAAQVANTVTRRFAAYLAAAPSTRKQLTTAVVEVATPPLTPSSISRGKLLITGAVLGLGLGVVLALITGAVRRSRADAEVLTPPTGGVPAPTQPQATAQGAHQGDAPLLQVPGVVERTGAAL